jgi:hypothetical protein
MTVDLNHKRTSDQGNDRPLPSEVVGNIRSSRPRGGSPSCPNPVMLQAEDGDVIRSTTKPCASRTCPECQDTVDTRDTARILASSPHDDLYHAQVPHASWDRHRLRANRHEVHLFVKMASADFGYIEVITDDPDILKEAQLILPDKVEALVRARPLGTSIHLSGRGLISIKDWERPQEEVARRVWVGPPRHKVSLETEAELAEELGLDFFQNQKSITYFHTWEDLDPLRTAILNLDTSRGWE